MKDFKFCPMCGDTLKTGPVEGRQRLHCKKCNWINYRNPLPVVSCLVKDPQGEVLLIKRGVEPCIGSWALPGGFIEIDENPAAAGARELKEETGLIGCPGRLIGVKSHKSPLYGAILMVGIEYFVGSFYTTTGDDALDAAFFSPSKLPEIPFPTHLELIDEFLNAHS